MTYVFPSIFTLYVALHAVWLSWWFKLLFFMTWAKKNAFCMYLNSSPAANLRLKPGLPA